MRVILLLVFFSFSLLAHSHSPPNSYTKDFYRRKHTLQTYSFVLRKKNEYIPPRRCEMGIWEALRYLDLLFDECDPGRSQSMHSFQTAECLRKAGEPKWLILTGFIHDLGKVLALYGEPHWAVVGDSYPVGCAFSDQVIFSEFFQMNPDSKHPHFRTKLGIYEEGCGLDTVHMSWGHDEYLYEVVKDYLPEQAAYIIRYHSFYAAYKEGAYDYLLSSKDRRLLPWVRLFHQYDEKSKGEEIIDCEALEPYYRDLIADFFPEKLLW